MSSVVGLSEGSLETRSPHVTERAFLVATGEDRLATEAGDPDPGEAQPGAAHGVPTPLGEPGKDDARRDHGGGWEAIARE